MATLLLGFHWRQKKGTGRKKKQKQPERLRGGGDGEESLHRRRGPSVRAASSCATLICKNNKSPSQGVATMSRRTTMFCLAQVSYLKLARCFLFWKEMRFQSISQAAARKLSRPQIHFYTLDFICISVYKYI